MYNDLILMSINEILSIKNIYIQSITAGVAIITALVTCIKFWNNISVNNTIAFEYKYLGNNIVYVFRHFLNIIGVVIFSLFVVASSNIFKVDSTTSSKEQIIFCGVISIMSVITYAILYKFFITSKIDYYYVDEKSGKKLYYRHINQKLNIVYYTMTSNKRDKRYITKTIDEDIDYVKEWEYREDGISFDNLKDGLDKKDKWMLVLYILIGIGTFLYALIFLSLSKTLLKLNVIDILVLYVWVQCVLLSYIFIPYIWMPLKEIWRRLADRNRKRKKGKTI